MTPPFTLNSRILTLVASISEQVGKLNVSADQSVDLRLRRINQVRTIHGTLAIEGNELSEAQITAILSGKRVIAPVKEVQEAKNAITVYEKLLDWKPDFQDDMLQAHQTLMLGLLDTAGQYRAGGVGVMKEGKVIHMAPPASRVTYLMEELFTWLASSDDHALIKSCVFHYEFEFIHPFSDGNGRMGRLWQTLILSQWQPLFAHLPVENLIHQNQDAYYHAINISTQSTDSAPFIEFMLSMIEKALNELDAVSDPKNLATAHPQVNPHVTPQVNRLLEHLMGEMSRDELQGLCQLKDRKSFSQRYLKPALEAKLIEMTIPDNPRSRSQRYRLTPQGQAVKDSL